MAYNIDLKLYEQSGRYFEINPASEEMDRVGMSAPVAEDIEVIGNKVVKFLLTSHGTDALEPDYGGRAFRTQQMAVSYIPKFRIELEKDVERCLRYIQAGQRAQPEEKERLTRIIVRRVAYDPILSPDRLDVYLELKTNKGNSALVSLPKSMR